MLLLIIENTASATRQGARGKRDKIMHVTQLLMPTLQFVFFHNLLQYIKEPYRRFENNICANH